MARSLLVNAFFVGSVLFTGALAQGAADGSIPSQPDAHAMQEQGKKFNKNKAENKIANLVSKWKKVQKKLDDADIEEFSDSNCDEFKEQCKDHPPEGGKKCEKGDQECKNCNKIAKRCNAAKTRYTRKLKAAEKRTPGLEKQVAAADTRLMNAVQDYRFNVFDCANNCGHGEPTKKVEASNCVCECDEDWSGAKCDQALTVTLPPSTRDVATAPCLEPGVQSVDGSQPAKWRASFPDDSLDSRMSEVVIDGTQSDPPADVFVDYNNTRTGAFAMKHVLTKESPLIADSKRSESHTLRDRNPVTRVDAAGSTTIVRQAPVSGIEKGKETYYGMSIYLGGEDAWPYYTDGDTPAAARDLVNKFGPVTRSKCKQADILFQWKANKGKPFMTLQQKYQGLYLSSNTGAWLTLVETMDRSKWYDIRIRVKWETEASGQGEIEAQIKTADQSTYGIPTWKGQAKDKTGKPLERVWHGATMDREADAYLKWGLYLDHWRVAAEDDDKTNGYYIDGTYTDEATGESKPNYQLHTLFNSRTVWHDNIAVGDSWDAVDPSVEDC